jgi:hypothetical protein
MKSISCLRLALVYILFLLPDNTLFSQTYKLYVNSKMYWSNEPDNRLLNIGEPIPGKSLKDSLDDGTYQVYTDSTMKIKYLTAHYINKLRTGIWTYYHQNGKPRCIVPYLKGVIHGKMIRYSYSGDTLELIEFSLDIMLKRTGWNTYYGLNEWEKQPSYIHVLYNDRLWVKTYYNSDGRVNYIDSTDKVTGKIHSITYSRTGIIQSEYFRDQYSGKERYVNHNKGIRNTTELKLSLLTVKDWLVMDSIIYYENLEFLSIWWPSNYGMYKDSLISLNKKLRALAKCKNLYWIEFSTNSKIPEAVYELKNIVSLSVICGSGIDAKIGMMTQLERLDWQQSEESSVAFQIPAELAKLTKLKSLVLKRCLMLNPDNEIRKLAPLKNLEELHFNICGFSQFPKSIVAIKSLRKLNFMGEDGKPTYSSTFTSLPEEFFTMTNLRSALVPTTIPNKLISVYSKRLPLCLFINESVCFTGETMITMSNGKTKQINEIQKGDIVLAYNFNTNSLDTSLVLHTITHSPQELTILKIETTNGNSMHVTPNHPIYCGNGQFEPAAHLSAQRALYSRGDVALLSESRVIFVYPYTATGICVYNFGTTKGNYFANGFLVHNK